MPGDPSKLSRFWQELKRRKVTRVITVYAAAAFVILQLVEILAPSLRLPGWTMNLILVLLIVGFIIAVILSWIYDVDPEGGIVKTETAEKVSEASAPPSSKGWRIASYISFVVIVALIVLNIIPRANRPGNKDILDKSIAVLPFQNDSSDDENAHFINGTMESILNNLCKIEGLRVPGRTTVEQYRINPKPIPVIANELNVSYILEGSGQKLGNRILLTIQLIEGKSDQHLWSRQYDREITKVEDLIDIQSDIAQLVAAELHAVITPQEKQLIETAPTANIKALGLYRRGRDEHMKYQLDNTNHQALSKAIAYYRSVLKEDPSFGKAYTGLASAIRSDFWQESWRNREFSESENQLYRDSLLYLVDLALSYDPNLDEAYMLRGDYYYGMDEYDRAQVEYNRALEINPNSSWVFYRKSSILFYNEGKWPEGIEHLLKAIDLETGPMQILGLRELGWYYEHSGFHNQAEDVYMQMLMLSGDSASYYEHIAGLAFCIRDWDQYIYWSEKILERDPDNYWAISQLIWAYAILGNIDSAYHYATQLLELKEDMVMHTVDIELDVGYIYWKKGRIEEASEMINRLIEYKLQLIGSEVGDKDYLLLTLAACYAVIGQPEKAMESIKQIDRYALKPNWFMITMEDVHFFQDIRADADFQMILNTLNATWQAEHERVRQWMEESDML